MTAENAVGLFVLAAGAVSAGAYWLIARAWDLWPFRAPEEEDGDACLGCGAEVDPESLKGTCGSLECDSWSRSPTDAWSGLDPRHGDDGNSGHG